MVHVVKVKVMRGGEALESNAGRPAARVKKIIAVKKQSSFIGWPAFFDTHPAWSV
jgi:hypothetical protein